MSPITLWIRLITIGIIGLLLVNFQFFNKKLAFQYLTSDSVLLDIYETAHSTGQLKGYSSRIQTPVCKDGLCYEVDLDFYWDVLGDFSHFKLIPNKPLTKLDHIPFDAADYKKLQQILLTKSPSFIHLRRSELINEPVDGITGATVKEVQKDMVEGAIYTCYTLWHIANGDLNFQMQEYTKQQLDESLIADLLNSTQVEAHFFLIENMEGKYFEMYWQELMDLAVKYDQYYLGSLLSNMPNSLLEKTIIQTFYVDHFQQLNYSSQKELLTKLSDNITINDRVLELLIEQIRLHKTEQNNHIVQLVGKHLNSEKKPLIKKLLTLLKKNKVELTQKSFDLLQPKMMPYPFLKKRLKKLVN